MIKSLPEPGFILLDEENILVASQSFLSSFSFNHTSIVIACGC